MKLTPNIHMLKHPFEIQFPDGQKIQRFVNSLIIFGKDITLVDSGIKNSIHPIFSYIEQMGRSVGDVKNLILSHSHPDHIGSAAAIKEHTACRVMAHRAEKDWIENIDLQIKNRPVPGFYELTDKSVHIDQFIEQDQILELDEKLHVKIIHAPGHSPGSINLYFIEDHILFTADSIPLKNDIPNYDNFPMLMESLLQIKNHPDIDILLSSWFEPLSDKYKIIQLIQEGIDYLLVLDKSIKENYKDPEAKPFKSCTKVVSALGMPSFFINPICDRSFRTHLL